MKSRINRKEEQRAIGEAMRLAETGDYADSLELEAKIQSGRVVLDNPYLRQLIDQACERAQEKRRKESEEE